ncbi:ABC transporter permease [Ectothiorhodospiraceae bacterium 2226]|nr:ABC transporter permease [Ectothiorhodospiraceae bacterium 2226]
MVARASLRHLARHPGQLALAVLGVALGVAVVVAIELVNHSARQAFSYSTEVLSGGTTHHIVGGPAGVDEADYARLRIAGLRPSAPVVEGHVELAAAPGEALQLLGVDVFADAPFRRYTATLDAQADLEALLTTPGAAVMSAELAERLGLVEGDRVEVRAGGRSLRLHLVGRLTVEDALTREVLAGVVLTDIATAQEWLGQPGRLTRIDLILAEGAEGERRLAQIAAALPPALRIEPVGARIGAMEQMTRAFRLNLTALSLLALVVGMFLIYNTMTFSVLQRRGLIGRLRVLGVTRGRIQAVVLGEALVVGVLGTALGVLAGIALAEQLLGLVTRTINDLYFVLNVAALQVDPGALARGAALGVGATLLAAWLPAREAAHTAPRAALARVDVERLLAARVGRAAALGALSLLLALGLLAVFGRGLVPGFAALALFIGGAVLLVPAATRALAEALRAPARQALGLPGAMAARGVVTSLSRSAPAVAALAVALAAAVGVALMIDSFRLSVERWLEGTLRADIYVSVPGGGSLDPALAARFAALPGVQAVSQGRRVRVDAPEGPTELFALDIPPASFAAFGLRRGDAERARAAFYAGEAVLVSEPLAWHRGLDVGDSLTLHTDRGPRAFPVAGIYRDYSSDQGVAALVLDAYQALYDDPHVSSFGIYAAPDADPAALLQRVRAAAPADQALQVQSNRALREASMAIFDQTFAITEVLRVIALAVAAVGLVSALLALQLERARELAVLRAIGFTPADVGRLVLAQSGLTGLIAGLLAVPLGWGLAWGLTQVINRRAFGWSMELVVTAGPLLQVVALAVVTALLASAWPAWRMARTPAAWALREVG